MATHLVWLRTDLRIHDNLALAAACRDPQAQVLALYIATPGQWRTSPGAAAGRFYRQPFAQSARRAGGAGHTAVGRRGGRF
jgi:deoxyribodipyrimidine photolyase